MISCGIDYVRNVEYEMDIELFLKYAYPCIEFWYENERIARKIKKPWREEFYKTVSKNLLNKLKEMATGKKHAIEIEKLEKLVPFAIRFLTKMGKRKNGKIIISEKEIREYFLKLHNKLIEKDVFGIHKLCEVRKGKVIKVEGNFATVKIGKEERKVKLDFIKRPRVGEKVIVHFFYAVEKI